MYYLDVETCGFVGPVVLIQYKERSKPTILYSVWHHPVKETLALLESLMREHLVIYNATFEAFHLNKLYNLFRLIKNPENTPNISEVAELEQQAWDGLCLKPNNVTDIMLLLKETHFQYLNPRKAITINRIPKQMVEFVTQQLTKLDLNPLLFNELQCNWQATAKDEGFVNLKLIFKPSLKLKSIVHYLFNIDTIGFNIPRSKNPDEQCQFSPKAKGLYRPWGHNWPQFIKYHIRWWNSQGKEYAEQDVLLLEILDSWLRGEISGKSIPESKIDFSNLDHLNSKLAWAVGACRQRGYAINIKKIDEALESMKEYNVPHTSPMECLRYLHKDCPDELRPLLTNTNKKTLTSISRNFGWKPCPDCSDPDTTDDSPKEEVSNQVNTKETNPTNPTNSTNSTDICPTCGGAKEIPTEIGKKVEAIIQAREQDHTKLILQRLKAAGRYHPDFNIIGTFSNRMSGAGGINPQGINRTIRDIFTLIDEGWTLSGGDFQSQELCIAAEIYQDKQLSDDIRSGFDIHANCAKNLFPEFLCELCEGTGKIMGEVCPECHDCGIIPAKTVTKSQRHVGKNGMVFPILYGAIEESIHHNTNIPLPVVKAAFKQFYERYQGAARFRENINERLGALTQEKGIGSKIYWKDPQPYIESLFKYRRHFDVEQHIIKFLFNLARNVPENDEVIIRTNREQTVRGATSSALYASCFAIQQRTIRAGANHVIQATGAQCTKILQGNIWELQPPGVNPWKVQPFNVHDEVIVPTTIPNQVAQVVKETISKLQEHIPLLKIDWKESMKDWSEK